MKFTFTWAIDGTCSAKVEAASVEEAKELARYEGRDVFPGFDFGDLENAGAQLIQIDDAEGNKIWEY